MATYTSLESEISVLGILISDQDKSKETIGLLSIEDFSNEQNKVVFKHIEILYENNEPLNVVSILNSIQNDDLDRNILNNPRYLTKLIESAGIKSNLNNYIKILKDKTQLRSLRDFIDEQRKYLDKTNEDVPAIIEEFEDKFFKTTRSNSPSKEVKVDEALDDYINKIINFDEKNSDEAVYSDFKYFDEITHGFRKGDLVIIAARPSMGKTAFSLALSTNVAYKKNVYFFSLEMSLEQITQRLLSSQAFIDSKVLKNPNKITSKDWAKIQEVKPIVSKLNLVIDDTPGIKIGELVWKVRNYALTNKLDMVVIDYLQLITQKKSSGNRQQDVSDISRILKTLARELNIPVVVLAQLNRSVEKREEKRPLMSDIRESGAIEQDADIICFLYREGYYDQEKNTQTQPVEIIVSKNRNGSTGSCKINLNMPSGRFLN